MLEWVGRVYDSWFSAEKNESLQQKFASLRGVLETGSPADLAKAYHNLSHDTATKLSCYLDEDSGLGLIHYCVWGAIGLQRDESGAFFCYSNNRRPLELAADASLRMKIQREKLAKTNTICRHMLQFLLANGFDPNLPDRSGMTAIHHALRSADIELLNILSARQTVRIWQSDAEGNTVLHRILPEHREYASELFRWFLRQPNAANYLNVTNKNGIAPLHLIATLRFRGQYDILRKMLQMGARADINNKKKETPLLLAVRHNDLIAVRLMLQIQANGIHTADQHGNTALHETLFQFQDPLCCRLLRQLTKLLVGIHGDKKIADFFNQNPPSFRNDIMHYCSKYLRKTSLMTVKGLITELWMARQEMMLLLLSADANPRQKNYSGETFYGLLERYACLGDRRVRTLLGYSGKDEEPEVYNQLAPREDFFKTILQQLRELDESYDILGQYEPNEAVRSEIRQFYARYRDSYAPLLSHSSSAIMSFSPEQYTAWEEDIDYLEKQIQKYLGDHFRQGNRTLYMTQYNELLHEKESQQRQVLEDSCRSSSPPGLYTRFLHRCGFYAQRSCSFAKLTAIQTEMLRIHESDTLEKNRTNFYNTLLKLLCELPKIPLYQRCYAPCTEQELLSFSAGARTQRFVFSSR